MKHLPIVVVFLCAAIPASAQSFIGPEIKFVDGSEPSLLLNGLVVKTNPVGTESAIGYYVYGLIDQSGWGQIHGGIAYSPRKWFGFTAGAGTERADNPWRVASSIWAAGHGNSALFIVEHGGGSFWYRAQYLRTVSSRVNVGIFSRRFSPTGPIVEVKATQRSTIWVAAGPNLENGRKTLVMGVNFSLP